ncbi:MAG: hypothetical protein ACLPXB_04285 [Thiobacillaceae bacterium]
MSNDTPSTPPEEKSKTPGGLATPSDPWKHAPKSISQWGYAVLVLLAVVSAITGLAKGGSGSLASVMLTAVITFGLFIALWAFERMTKAEGEFWSWVGKVAGVVVLFAMVAVFCSVLSYLAVGQPAWMDAWFRPGYHIDGPTHVDVRAGALLKPKRDAMTGWRVTDPTLGLAKWFVGTARADEVPARGDPHTTVTVIWDRSLPARTRVEIAIKPHNDTTNFPSPIKVVEGDAGVAQIGGLKEGTTYDLQIVAEKDGRRSLPSPLLFTTDADNHPVAMFPGFLAKYSGSMTRQGLPNDPQGHLLLVPEHTNKKTANWNYDGSFRVGQIDGNGTLQTDPLDCRATICGSVCEGSFVADEIQHVHCSLTLDGIIGRMKSRAGQGIWYTGVAAFKGDIAGKADKRIEQALAEVDHRPLPASVVLGPFLGWFDGVGTLRAEDPKYTDVYDGSWELGALDKGSRMGTNGGILASGQEYEQAHCLLAMTPFKGSAVGGDGGRFTCRSAEFGERRNGDDPYRGFEIDWGDSLFLWWYDGGDRLMLPLKKQPFSFSDACYPEETYGFLSLPHEPAESAWQLHCDPTAFPFECALSAKQADVSIVGHRPLSSIPQFEFRTSGNVRGGTTLVEVDGSQRDLPPRAKQVTPINYALLGEMCSGTTLMNKEQGHSVPLAGFCPRLALMFTQLYTCGVDIGDQGLGPDGSPVRDPDPALFNADNFLTPQIISEPGNTRFELWPVRFNEGFYIATDLVGKLSMDISVGENCEQAFHQEFPLGLLSNMSMGMGRYIFKKKEWSPATFRWGLDQTADRYHIYQKLPTNPAFNPSDYKCYRSATSMMFFIKATFAYGGASATRVYQVNFPQDGLPTVSDISSATTDQFSALKKSYEAHLAEKNIDLVTLQEIGIKFDSAGLRVDWRSLK